MAAVAGHRTGYLRRCHWFCASSERRRLREFNRQLPEAIDLMSRALRAGHSLAAAIEIVGEECPEPVRTEFREVYRQQNFGLPARDALVQLAQTHAYA